MNKYGNLKFFSAYCFRNISIKNAETKNRQKQLEGFAENPNEKEKEEEKNKIKKKEEKEEKRRKKEENRRNVQTYQNDQSRDGVACQEEVPASAYCKRRRLDLGTQSRHSIHEPQASLMTVADHWVGIISEDE